MIHTLAQQIHHSSNTKISNIIHSLSKRYLTLLTFSCATLIGLVKAKWPSVVFECMIFLIVGLTGRTLKVTNGLMEVFCWHLRNVTNEKNRNIDTLSDDMPSPPIPYSAEHFVKVCMKSSCVKSCSKIPLLKGWVLCLSYSSGHLFWHN